MIHKKMNVMRDKSIVLGQSQGASSQYFPYYPKARNFRFWVIERRTYSRIIEEAYGYHKNPRDKIYSRQGTGLY